METATFELYIYIYKGKKRFKFTVIICNIFYTVHATLGVKMVNPHIHFFVHCRFFVYINFRVTAFSSIRARFHTSISKLNKRRTQ